MKGQHLFYSFLPGVTVAVLSTQPAVAEEMKVNSLQYLSSHTVLATDDIHTFVAGKNPARFPNAQVEIYPNIIPNSVVTTTNSAYISSQSHSVISAKNTGIDKKRKSPLDEIKTLKQNSHERILQRLKQQRLLTNQPEILSGIRKQELAKKDTFNTALSNKQTVAENPESQQNLSRQLSTVVDTGTITAGGAKLLAINSCSSETCQISNRIEQQVTQANTTAQVNPAPTQSQPATTESIPSNTQSPSRVEVPQNLIPNANPLQFPTKPEEVKIQENQPITLAQSLELARRNNRDLQVSLLQVQRSEQAVKEAQAALLPSLSVSSDITRSQSPTTQLQDEQISKQGGIGNSDQPSTAFNGTAQLSYDLYTSGRRNATIQQAEEQLRFDKLDAERQAEEIRLNVTTAYYNLQQADEQVRIARSAVENAQASLRDAEALERAGVGTRFDVLRSQVNLANNTQQLTTRLTDQATSRRQLATLLGIPQSVNISAADPVQLAGLWNQSLEQSIVLAYQNRPELQQQLAQRNISEQQRRQALANLGPQFSFVANYNLLDQFDDGIGVTDGYSVSVRANWNLYDGGAARARAAQARTNKAIAETRFASQRDQVRFQVEQAFNTQLSSLQNVQTSELALTQAREALRLARLRFQAGVGTQTDVINSENDLTVAEGNRITAILDYNRALANLQRAVTSRALTQ